MNKKILLITLMLVASLAYAHQGMTHVKGTVAKISADSITVTTTANGTVVVMIGAQTKFSKGGAAVDMKDLKPGDRVVIHARKVGEALRAESVQIGAPGHAAESPAKSP
jgi:hypothetical protein